jgi:L-threonylcarbamoyladenylate synthase
LAQAAALIRRGELVAFPTETVYGLGANALDPDAVARIYAAKGRPAWNPVIVHVADISAAKTLTSAWPERATRLAEACWPGPLTLVLAKNEAVPSIVSAGGDTVAIRIPSHPAALSLLRAADVPIAAPSANRFTQISPTTAEHVAMGLGDRVSMILDGGPCEIGIESTVVDVTGDEAVILRPGQLSADTLSHLLGERVQMRSHALDHTLEHAAPQRSPGNATRHYAPRADVWLTNADDLHEVQRAIVAGSTARVGVLAIDGGIEITGAHRTLHLPATPGGYARGLYAALHTLDNEGCTVIVIQLPPAGASWDGVRDRILRATR